MGYELINCNIDNLTLKYTCGHQFEIHRSLFNQRNRFGITVCTICISSIYHDEVLLNKKIGKYEIDIFLPKLNIGIECNGLWWHSELYREKNYHIDKMEYFKKLNITIINIWEDWWKYKNEIIKSIIQNILKLSSNKIYTKYCTLSEKLWEL